MRLRVATQDSICGVGSTRDRAPELGCGIRERLRSLIYCSTEAQQIVGRHGARIARVSQTESGARIVGMAFNFTLAIGSAYVAESGLDRE
jgi:hypothetical protein